MLKTTYKYKVDRTLTFAVGIELGTLDLALMRRHLAWLTRIGDHKIAARRRRPLGNERSGTTPLFAAAPAAAEYVPVRHIGAAPLERHML